MKKTCRQCMREFDSPNKARDYCSPACNQAAYDHHRTDPRGWQLLREQAEEVEVERAQREGEAALAQRLEPLIRAALDHSPCHTARTPGGIVVTRQEDGSYHVYQYQLEGDYLDARFDTLTSVAKWVASDNNYMEPGAEVWEPASEPLSPLDHTHQWRRDPNPARQDRDTPAICIVCSTTKG